MDAVTIGGFFISAALQVIFDRLAPNATTIWHFFKGSKSNGNKMLEELENTLISVSKVLDDAEQKEISNSQVRKWLDKIKDVVYDADDLLAEIDYDSRVIAAKSSSSEATRPLHALGVPSGEEHNFEEKLDKILDRLGKLKKDAKVLGLVEGIGQGAPRHLPLDRRTTALVLESDVHGRQSDKEAITTLLTLEDTKSVDGLGVIAIVGMGGLGKTTLAQLVYGQTKVSEHFQLKTWVCVSENYDVFLIARNILKGFAPELSNVDLMNDDVVHSKLKDALTGKKFLLVLDDIWDERPQNLDLLMRPLKCGMQGSRIIVTTRSPIVASLTSTVPAYSMELLSDDESWSIFARCAFHNEDPSTYPDLVPIGKQIVTKCGGLPLAANSLGNLLRITKKKRKWEDIRDSEIWNLKEDQIILPALRLSYHWLPSRLKRCFAYCALFPKDYEFDRKELVRLWMADGILDSCEETKSKKEIGDDYFDDLLSRSFFQRPSMNSLYFVMHDLIHDLATSVAGDFYFRVKDGYPSSQSREPRHVSYLSATYNTSKKFEGIFSSQSLRSFLAIRSYRRKNDQYMAKDVVKHLLEASKCLRVLSLSNYVNIKEVPESIVNLKLLRYLDLSGTSLRRLPDTICKLWNMESLLLADCKFLEEIPESIVDLKDLHFLHLSGTAIKQLPSKLCNLVKLCFLDISRTNLQEMPPNLGNLTRLQILSDFFVGDKNSCCSSMKELKKLSKLKGKRLCIWNIQNAQVASESNLKDKEHLRTLQLSWKGDDADDSHQELKVLEGLEPPYQLKDLTISGYRGTYFSEWVGRPSFSNLFSLRIEKCINCFEMPPLGQLDSLKELHIIECPNIEIIGSSFYGNNVSATDKQPFKSLQILRFEKLSKWRIWEQHDGAFPNLEELCISDCPRLVNALPGELPSLKNLWIKDCDQLGTPFPTAPAIVQVWFEDEICAIELNPRFDLLGKCTGSILSLDQILKDLQRIGASIYNQKEVAFKFHCSRIGHQSWEEFLLKFECLHSLSIHDCSKLNTFPECELAFQNLTKLELRNLPNLKSLPKRMNSILPSLLELRLIYCPELESFPERGLSSKLEKLEILRCKKLMSGRIQWNLQALPSLSYLKVDGFEDREPFPESMLLPSTLTTLELWNLKSLSSIHRFSSLRRLSIDGCDSISEVPLLPSTITSLALSGMNIKSLDGCGLQRLTSLEELEIWCCDFLEFIIKEALPSSLRVVTLQHCPMLGYITREGLPPSLEHLDIVGCPLLEEKYNDKEEEWHLISHIPNTYIVPSRDPTHIHTKKKRGYNYFRFSTSRPNISLLFS